jgi:hypothetical protein
MEVKIGSQLQAPRLKFLAGPGDPGLFKCSLRDRADTDCQWVRAPGRARVQLLGSPPPPPPNRSLSRRVTGWRPRLTRTALDRAAAAARAARDYRHGKVLAGGRPGNAALAVAAAAAGARRLGQLEAAAAGSVTASGEFPSSLGDSESGLLAWGRSEAGPARSAARPHNGNEITYFHHQCDHCDDDLLSRSSAVHTIDSFTVKKQPFQLCFPTETESIQHLISQNAPQDAGQ